MVIAENSSALKVTSSSEEYLRNTIINFMTRIFIRYNIINDKDYNYVYIYFFFDQHVFLILFLIFQGKLLTKMHFESVLRFHKFMFKLVINNLS